LAAAAKDKVWAVEHERGFADALEGMVADAGLSGVMLVTADLKDGWYDIDIDLPPSFGMAFVDGPPRSLADRTRFFDAYGDRCKVILCDDANSPSYVAFLKSWAASRGRELKMDGRAAVILPAAENVLYYGRAAE